MTAAAPAPDVAALLAQLQACAEQGWLRRLDHAFAAFIAGLRPDVPPAVVMAAALLAEMEGRGHACLPLDELQRDADELLARPAAAAPALRQLLATLPPVLPGWLLALRSSALVWCTDPAAAQADARQPLVLRGHKLYLRRYHGYEQQVATAVRSRDADAHAIDPAAARPWFDRLFAPAVQGSDAAVDWQKVACGIALGARLAVITGGPGTGKTYTAARLLALIWATAADPARLRVALAAPTGKAAARLKQSIATAIDELQPRVGALPLRDLLNQVGAARTLHALLGARPDTRRYAHDAAHPLDLDLLIVDEASMVHLEMMAALLAALPARTRVVLLGDKDQLASVEAGAVLGDLCGDAEQGQYRRETAAYVQSVTGEQIPEAFQADGPPRAQRTVMLRAGRRFTGAIGELARAVNRGDAAAATALLHAAPAGALHELAAPTPAAVVDLALHGRPGAGGGLADCCALLRQGPPHGVAFDAWALRVVAAAERSRILCAVRGGDWGTQALNAAIERALDAQGLLAARAPWYEGRLVIVTRNDPGAGVYNGDVGIVLRPPPAGGGAAPPALRAYFAAGTALRSVGVSRLADVETAWAMTVHKSQGSEFEHAVLVLPDEPSRVASRELVYTAVTRARVAFTLASGRAPALAEALARRTWRASGLAEQLPSEAGRAAPAQ